MLHFLGSVCMYVCMYTNANVTGYAEQKHACVCMYVCMYAFMTDSQSMLRFLGSVCMYVCICICMYMYVCTMSTACK
jgi:hypothetical protein